MASGVAKSSAGTDDAAHGASPSGAGESSAGAAGAGGTGGTDRPAGLDLAADREAAPALPAATVLILREAAAGLEVFCVQRHQGIAFMGGAVVFPGGKLDPADHVFAGLATDPAPVGTRLIDDGDEAALRALAVAACREAAEEAAIVAARRPDGSWLDDAEALAVRVGLDAGRSFEAELAMRGARLELAALVPFARWVTPTAERRRYDARFFLLHVPAGQQGHHDGKETTRGFWDTPAGVLARFAAGEVQLAPPTTRSLELLAASRTLADAIAVASAQSLRPVCPHFVPGDPPVLALPGDPAHPVAEARVAGPSRFVLRDGRFVSEEPAQP